MRQLSGALFMLLLTVSCYAQKPAGTPVKVTHILTPFNGMKSGFNTDGTAMSAFTAHAATIKGIVDFTPSNRSSKPCYKFGYIQMVYDQKPNDNLIQLSFPLPPSQDFTVTLTVTTQVNDSKFGFTFDRIDNPMQIKIAKKGVNHLKVHHTGNPTGSNTLVINPMYKMDATTFLLTEIKIETN